jgi:hypothetical protein
VISRKYALKQGNRISVGFIKYDKQGVFLKYAAIVAQKINVILFFDRIF